MNDPSDGVDSRIDDWDAGECIAFLEADGSDAPEYDLETDAGIAMLRRDCRALVISRNEAA